MQAASSLRASALPTVTDTLRVVETLLMSRGHRTARRNAWTSVLEDRRRARARVEAEDAFARLDGSVSARTS
ncbi:hypothetical protein [Streptomyces sp. NPDC050560]|uniref:SCO2195 family GlnR-regulated protein n=1 Tax=Streptomyces sp. NPDC050560 TaxID=3365630 RepID=UPI0037B9BB5A